MARSGRRTAVVERRWIGGSRPNINCLPSKNEIWSAKVADLVHHGESFGAKTDSVPIDMAKVGRVQTRVTLSWSELIGDTRLPLFFRNEHRHEFLLFGRGQSVQRCSQRPCNFIAVES
jgi:hypothetical protein